MTRKKNFCGDGGVIARLHCIGSLSFPCLSVESHFHFLVYLLKNFYHVPPSYPPKYFSSDFDELENRS